MHFITQLSLPHYQIWYKNISIVNTAWNQMLSKIFQEVISFSSNKTIRKNCNFVYVYMYYMYRY